MERAKCRHLRKGGRNRRGTNLLRAGAAGSSPIGGISIAGPEVSLCPKSNSSSGERLTSSRSSSSLLMLISLCRRPLLHSNLTDDANRSHARPLLARHIIQPLLSSRYTHCLRQPEKANETQRTSLQPRVPAFHSAPKA